MSEENIKLWEARSDKAFAEGDSWNGRYSLGVAHGLRLALGPAKKPCNNTVEDRQAKGCNWCYVWQRDGEGKCLDCGRMFPPAT